MAEAITKAELARELNVSRARISQLCAIGLPVRPDGRVNRVEALVWVKANVCSWRGGWGSGLRQKKAARPRDVEAVQESGPEMPEADRSFDYQLLPAYWQGAVDIVNALRRPGNVGWIAEMAVAQGCTAAQAFGVAQLYDFLLALWMHGAAAEMLNKEEADVIHFFETEPDWSGIAQMAGEPVNVQAWKQESKRRMEDWSAHAEGEAPASLEGLS